MRRNDLQHRKRWDTEDDAELAKQVESGVTYKKLMVSGHTLGSTRQRYKQLGLRCIVKANTGVLGTVRSKSRTVRPSTNEIHRAAAWFDAEGHAGYYANTTRVDISQKDPEILYWLQGRFGGTVQQREGKTGSWVASGSRARGFLMTVYSLLTQRRKKQVRQALSIVYKAP